MTKTKILLLAAALTGAFAGSALAVNHLGGSDDTVRADAKDKDASKDKSKDKDAGKDKSACGGKDGCGGKH